MENIFWCFIQVQHDGSRRLYNRLKTIVKDKRKGSVIFHNEFQTYAHCEREKGELQAQWHTRFVCCLISLGTRNEPLRLT